MTSSYLEAFLEKVRHDAPDLLDRDLYPPKTVVWGMSRVLKGEPTFLGPVMAGLLQAMAELEMRLTVTQAALRELKEALEHDQPSLLLS